MREKRGSLFLSVLIITIFGASSGIFHKANFILQATGGNVWQGVLSICIGGIMVVFGSVALWQLFQKTSCEGVISVFEQNTDKSFACGFSWFYTFICMPCVAVVLSWVAGLYTVNLFGYTSETV